MKEIIEKLTSLKGKSGTEILDFAKENKKLLEKILLAVILLICLVIFLAGKDDGGEMVLEQGGEMEAASVVSDTGESGTGGNENLLPGEIYIDVSGAVEKPGVVKLAEGARIFQAIDAAGGVSSLADTSMINLAMILNDGDKIYVPFVGELDADGNAAGNNSASETTGYRSSGAYGNNSGGVIAGVVSGANNGKININTASADELQTISGIGVVTAGKIVDYRNQNGKFKTIEDLKNVSGIGNKTFEKLKDNICV